METSSESEEFESMGNNEFTKGRFEEAIKIFTKAIQLDDSNLVYFLNRSQSFLCLNKYEEALHDTNIGLEKISSEDEMYFKLVWKKVQALIGLEEYHLALELTLLCIEKLSNKNQENYISIRQQFSNILNKLKTDVNFIKGKFEVSKIFNKLINKESLDLPNYINPKIEIKYINEQKGRGIFATSDIKAGEIITIEKPFLYEKKEKMEKLVVENVLSQKARKIFQNQFIKKCKLNKVNQIRCLYLFSTPYLKSDINFYKSDNYFKIIQPTAAGLKDSDEDIEKVDVIDAMNKLSFQDVRELDRRITRIYDQYTGLYLLSSYYNHACNANIYNYFINGFMVCEAVENISKGEELFVTYIKRENYEYRRNKLYLEKNMICSCILCESYEDTIGYLETILEGTFIFFHEYLKNPSKISWKLNELLSLYQTFQQNNSLYINDSVFNKMFEGFSEVDLNFNKDQIVIRDKLFIELFKSKILTFNYETFINEML
jgi:hypothetical protein